MTSIIAPSSAESKRQTAAAAAPAAPESPSAFPADLFTVVDWPKHAKLLKRGDLVGAWSYYPGGCPLRDGDERREDATQPGRTLVLNHYLKNWKVQCAYWRSALEAGSRLQVSEAAAAPHSTPEGAPLNLTRGASPLEPPPAATDLLGFVCCFVAVLPLPKAVRPG